MTSQRVNLKLKPVYIVSKFFSPKNPPMVPPVVKVAVKFVLKTSVIEASSLPKLLTFPLI